MYKERAAIEKDYAAKLHSLAKKVSEKKAKRMVALIVGEEPSKQWNEDVIRQRFDLIYSMSKIIFKMHLYSTLDYAYTQLVSSLEVSGQCHNGYADALNSQVLDTAKTLEQKHEEIKKKVMHVLCFVCGAL